MSGYNWVMKNFLLIVFSALLLSDGTASAIDYKKDVLPIMKEHCWQCHSNEKSVKGNLALDDLDEMRDYQVGPHNIIQPGKADTSSFLAKIKLPKGDSDFMPRKGESLPKKEIAIIEEWIQKGAVIDAENPAKKEKQYVNAGAGDSKMGTSTSQEFLKWTSSEGKVIEARFMGLAGADAVKLLMKNGKSYNVPFSRLGADSVAQAKKMAGN